MYSKSNQFKFSGNNDNFESNAQSVYFEIFRENGENLGICSAITYSITDNTIMIHNWAMSCRYFQIGVEEFILLFLAQIAGNRKIEINYQQSEYNLKVTELLEKHNNVFIENKQNHSYLIEFKKNIIKDIKNNIRLKEINNG